MILHGLKRSLPPVGVGLLLAVLRADAQTNWVTVDTIRVAGHNLDVMECFSDPTGAVLVLGIDNASTSFRWMTRRSQDQGTSWVTGYLTPGEDSFLGTADPDGNIYLVNKAGQTASAYYWIVRKSSDGGATWTVVDNSYVAGETKTPQAILCDADGRVFVAGSVQPAGGGAGRSLIRRSSDGGQTWTNAATLTSPYGYGEGPKALLAAPSGLFMAGSGTVYAGGKYTGKCWVRRSRDGGATWTMVDQLQLVGDLHTAPYPGAMTVDEHGRLYYLGSADVGGGVYQSFVRRSLDEGQTWATVYASTNAAGTIAVDKLGQVFLGGSLGASGYWRVFVSADAGQSWRLSDHFRLESGQASQIRKLAVDRENNIYAAGYGYRVVGGVRASEWVVRKLAPPPTLWWNFQAGPTQLQFSWPTNTPGYVLQSATTLSQGGDWTDTGRVPEVVDGRNVVTLETTRPAAFFRLRKP